MLGSKRNTLGADTFASINFWRGEKFAKFLHFVSINFREWARKSFFREHKLLRITFFIKKFFGRKCINKENI